MKSMMKDLLNFLSEHKKLGLGILTLSILLIGLGAGLPECKYPGKHIKDKDNDYIPNKEGHIPGYSILMSG